jgi:hypothetical protein
MAKSKKKIPSLRDYYYDLPEVYQKIHDGQYIIAPKARQSAYNDFGWYTKDIADTYLSLKPIHFYKLGKDKYDHLRVIAIYKVRFRGEDIYTHFYIDDNIKKLVINSFKRE